MPPLSLVYLTFCKSLYYQNHKAHLTKEKVQNSKDDVKREFSSEQSEEPLGGKHVDLQTHLSKVGVQVRQLVLGTHTPTTMKA